MNGKGKLLPWQYNPGNLTLALVLDDYGLAYEVDLENCRTSAEVLDWIIQTSGKVWATHDVIAGLVLALDHLLDLQANHCSCGEERGPVNVRELLARRYDGAGRAEAGLRVRFYSNERGDELRSEHYISDSE